MIRHEHKAVPVVLLGPGALVREVEMEVIFGTPSRNCAGAGICLITNRFSQGYAVPCPHAPAIIHLVPGQELVFRFRKRQLSDAALRGYFQENFFAVEEAFRLPQALVRQWKLPVRWIKPGQYLLEEYSQEWRLYFPF